MRIQPTTNYCYYNKPVSGTAAKNPSEPSFKSASSWLILLVAREGLSALANRKKYNYILALNEHVNGFYDKETFPALLQALAKTSNDFYDGSSSKIKFLAFMDSKKLDTIEALRWGGLSKLLMHDIEDNSYKNIQTKKDFVMSFIDNYHPISKHFLWYFERLNDKVYGTFKVELADKVLFSEKYNKVRCNINVPGNGDLFQYTYKPELDKYMDEYAWVPVELRYELGKLNNEPGADNSKHALRAACYQNLQLLATMDKNFYKSFFASRRNAIDQCKRIVEEGMEIAKRDDWQYWATPDAKSFENDYIRNLKTI